MSAPKPFGIIDPNSDHQMWSRWTFSVYGGKAIPIAHIRDNAARWLSKGFGSVGRARIWQQLRGRNTLVTYIECEVEGVPAHDPGYVTSVRTAFTRFVQLGWGTLAVDHVSVKILAGDTQDGKPRTQLIVMPKIIN